MYQLLSFVTPSLCIVKSRSASQDRPEGASLRREGKFIPTKPVVAWLHVPYIVTIAAFHDNINFIDKLCRCVFPGCPLASVLIYQRD